MSNDIHVYYLRDTNRKPYATIAIKKTEDSVWCRGVSICSVDDPFNKRIGKQIAIDRLNKAINTKKSDIIKEYMGNEPLYLHKSATIDKYIEQMDVLAGDNVYENVKNYKIEYKSAYDAKLTKYEDRIANKPLTEKE